PFGFEKASVARTEHSAIRACRASNQKAPDFASFHTGYALRSIHVTLAIWSQCMTRTENGRTSARTPTRPSQDLNELAITFSGEAQFMRFGDVTCTLRHCNFGIGGGFKLKWPAKIATLVSATAIIMAGGFGALGADVNKELSPNADLQKYSFDHRAKL